MNIAQVWVAGLASLALAASFFLLVVPPGIFPAADSFFVDVTLPAWPPIAALGLIAGVMAAVPRARGWLSWIAVGVLLLALVLLGSLMFLLMHWLAGAAAL